MIDLIFMDVQTAEMDGFEATRRIREKASRLARKLEAIGQQRNFDAATRETV
jgi:CheY-like chemotaxis protein